VPSQKLPADYARLGQVLRELRHAASLTQVQAAALIGVRSQFISEVERGNRGLRWHTLLALLAAYGANLHDLADGLDSVAV
jgi:transcriptional regulator with XRE-family HTH domain